VDDEFGKVFHASFLQRSSEDGQSFAKGGYLQHSSRLNQFSHLFASKFVAGKSLSSLLAFTIRKGMISQDSSMVECCFVYFGASVCTTYDVYTCYSNRAEFEGISNIFQNSIFTSSK